MTEKKMEPVRVGDLSADEFFAEVSKLSPAMEKNGSPTLVSLSAQEFLEAMLSEIRSRAYRGAAFETMTRERVLADIEGLADAMVVSTPFHMGTLADVEKFTETCRNALAVNGGGAEIVCVMAVRQVKYKPVSR